MMRRRTKRLEKISSLDVEEDARLAAFKTAEGIYRFLSKTCENHNGSVGGISICNGIVNGNGIINCNRTTASTTHSAATSRSRTYSQSVALDAAIKRGATKGVSEREDPDYDCHGNDNNNDNDMGNFNSRKRQEGVSTTTTTNANAKRTKKSPLLLKLSTITPSLKIQNTKKSLAFKKSKQNHFNFENANVHSHDGDPACTDVVSVFEENKKYMKDLWMCAYCGAAFASNELAAEHESACIAHAFELSGSRSDNPCTAQAVAITKKSKIPGSGAGDEMLAPYSSGMIELPQMMKMCMVLTDESLFKVAHKAKSYLMTTVQRDAQRELHLKARDRTYHDVTSTLSLRNKNRGNKFKGKKRPRQQQGKGLGLMAGIKTRLSDAYELIKEGHTGHEQKHDQYDRKIRGEYGSGATDTKHDEETLYINIIVKHSITFVHNELERLARQRWIDERKEYTSRTHFDRIRSMAQVQAVRFAQIALAADMTPANVAVQLSNDLYRLIPAQLRQFGAEINTDIEYRKGAFFILSVNVLSIDWIILMKHFHQVVQARKDSWSSSQAKPEEGDDDADADKEPNMNYYTYNFASLIRRFTIFEFVEQCLAILYHVHWAISVPLCSILYKHFLKNTIKRFIITAVTDDFFQYVERKGMEMDLEVVQSKNQAAFMLEAMHQIRKEEQALTKKIEAEEDGSEVEEVLFRGALLGPLVALDDSECPPMPIPLTQPPPNNLETICLELDLPVGYRRLRRALLLNPKFLVEANFIDALSYTEVNSEPWDKHSGIIGSTEDMNGIDESEFVGARMKYQYLMPKSAFVKANMAYEDVCLTSYNDNYFSLMRTITNPDVPYGNSFKTLSQIVIYNSGGNSSRMVCSCEAEFPNGPPMVARQIKSAMRAGTTESYVILGEAICKYADVFD